MRTDSPMTIPQLVFTLVAFSCVGRVCGCMSVSLMKERVYECISVKDRKRRAVIDFLFIDHRRRLAEDKVIVFSIELSVQ